MGEISLKLIEYTKTIKPFVIDQKYYNISEFKKFECISVKHGSFGDIFPVIYKNDDSTNNLMKMNLFRQILQKK